MTAVHGRPIEAPQKVHESHVMEIENGAAYEGKWYGTFRCRRCKLREYRPRRGEWIASPNLYRECG